MHFVPADLNISCKFEFKSQYAVCSLHFVKATLNQVGAPTVFWTLSCAECHWPEYHALFSYEHINDLTNSEIRDNVIKYPHLLDCFFNECVEAFVKNWLYNVLGAQWHWYRFEFSVLRGAIHCHVYCTDL